MKTPTLASLFLATFSMLALPGIGRAINVDVVTVGDIGNPNDTTGQGGVNYAYSIGKYEVTLLQYTAFLNAVAATDTYSLFRTTMQTDPSSGISRSGVSGSFSYGILGDGNRPVTYVSWFDAARFTNWLHNGQPVGLQVAGTTEAGAYNLAGAVSGNSVARSLGANYWLPSRNEWYKAAYYQPAAAGGDTDGYWFYPTQSNPVPYSAHPSASTPDNTRVANFNKFDGVVDGYDDGYAVTGSTAPPTGNMLTAVGAYAGTDTYYGTYDQAGNVHEWTDGTPTANPFVRGGDWANGENALRATTNSAFASTMEIGSLGFRIATVPEPSSALLLASAGLGLLLRRRR